MLLLNRKPVAQEWLKDQCTLLGLKLENLQKPTTFRLVESYWRKVVQLEGNSNQMRERTFVAPEFHIEATYLYSNKQTGLTENLTYVRNFVPDASGHNSNAIEPIIFERGICAVDEGQADLFFFLLNSPINKNNPKYADGKTKPYKPFQFTQILPDVEASDFVDYELAISKAVSMIGDPSYKHYVNDEAAIALAKSYGYGSMLNKGRKDVNKFLIEKAKKNPTKLISDLTSATTEVRAVLADAIAHGIIVQDLPYIKWTDLDKGKRKANNGIITQVPSGLDPLDHFTYWMRENDNSGVFNQLKKELENKKLALADEQLAL